LRASNNKKFEFGGPKKPVMDFGPKDADLNLEKGSSTDSDTQLTLPPKRGGKKPNLKNFPDISTEPSEKQDTPSISTTIETPSTIEPLVELPKEEEKKETPVVVQENKEPVVEEAPIMMPPPIKKGGKPKKMWFIAPTDDEKPQETKPAEPETKPQETIPEPVQEEKVEKVEPKPEPDHEPEVKLEKPAKGGFKKNFALKIESSEPANTTPVVPQSVPSTTTGMKKKFGLGLDIEKVNEGKAVGGEHGEETWEPETIVETNDPIDLIKSEIEELARRCVEAMSIY
jgi:hypothetical protein